MEIQKGQDGRVVSLESYRILRAADEKQVHIRATLLIKTPTMVPEEIRVTLHYSDDDMPHYDELGFGRRLLDLLKRGI